MNAVIIDSLNFTSYAILAFFFQNAIFSRALGVSRLVQLIGDEDTSSYYFGAVLCIMQIISAPIGFYLDQALTLLPVRSAYLTPLAGVFSIITASLILYGILTLIKQKIKPEIFFALSTVLPIATFNSCVLGTLLITTKQDYTILQSITFGFGSGLGYIFAVALVTSAQKKLGNKNVPKAFRGLPITLLYIGIVALAIYGFTGHTVII